MGTKKENSAEALCGERSVPLLCSLGSACRFAAEPPQPPALWGGFPAEPHRCHCFWGSLKSLWVILSHLCAARLSLGAVLRQGQERVLLLRLWLWIEEHPPGSSQLGVPSQATAEPGVRTAALPLPHVLGLRSFLFPPVLLFLQYFCLLPQEGSCHSGACWYVAPGRQEAGCSPRHVLVGGWAALNSHALQPGHKLLVV